jgi:hypothetical protein
MPSANPWGIFGGTGGGVNGVTGTAPITVDNTDPANPIIGLSGGVGVVLHTENFVAAALQTLFNLAFAPSVPSSTLLFVDGVQYRYGVDFTVVGTAVTWLDTPFTLGLGNTVSIFYGV